MRKKSRMGAKCSFLFSNLVAFSVAVFISVASVRAAGKEPEADSATIIRKTALYLQQTLPPMEYNPADSDVYLSLIKPLISRGNAASSELRALKLSGNLSPFETRVVEMLIARIEHPERFEKVSPYLIPQINPWPELIMALSRYPEDSPGTADFRVLDLDLMHPKVREAVAKYPKVFTLAKEAYNELLADATTSRKARDYGAMERNVIVLKEKLTKARQEGNFLYSEDPDYYVVIIAAEAVLNKNPDLDPDYLLAWEEGMLRPIPWVLKCSFVTLLADLNNPATAPSFGVVLRQALEALNNDTKKEYSEFISMEAMRALIRFPSKEAAIELSETIRLMPLERKKFIFRIGLQLSESEAWQKFLNLTPDPSMQEHRERLLHAIDDYRARMRARAVKK